ncbi:MAG: glycosyltransferase [Gammaproteobacteria bacterium]|nr:glycosyltransferase [Gammaproteobacteria bacterium]
MAMQRPITILHIASGDLWAGAEVQLYHLTRHLARQENIQVQVILFNEGELAARLKAAGITVTVFSEQTFNTYGLYQQVAGYIKQQRPDIIHSHRQKENLIAGIIAKINGIQSLRTVHGASEHSRQLKQRIVTWIDSWVGRHWQQRVIAVSDDLAQQIAPRYPNKVVTISNSIDLSEVLEKSQQPISLRLAPDCFHLGFVGRLSEVKQVHKIITILAYVKELRSNLNIHLHIVGEGPLQAELEQLAEQLNVAKLITFYGFLSNPQPYLKQFNALMFTSKHEGLPITLLEAMVLKTPVIATALPTFKALLDEMDNEAIGNFIDDDERAAAAQILEYIEHQERLKVNAEKAFQRVDQHFNIEKNILEYVELYQEMCP